ncbi:isoprenyl transferase [Bacteroidota bacterium]
MNLIDKIDKENIPEHIAIIMDGNGRWAAKKGNKRIFGHRNGVKAVKESVEAAGELGVKYLTLYAFSTENWNRPENEVKALMSLLVSTLNDELDNLLENDVKLNMIGDFSCLPSIVQNKLNDAIKKTKDCKRLNLILALSYSSRWEILNATKMMCKDVVNKKLRPEDITSKELEKYMETSNIPDPDLLIRTSGEYRISNFLLWQIAYSELFFTETLWPDFRKEDLYEAIVDFQSRERRYGKTSEQVKECK